MSKAQQATEERLYVPGIEIPFVEPGTPSVGVVLEGGGFRGMYTAGVLDVEQRQVVVRLGALNAAPRAGREYRN